MPKYCNFALDPLKLKILKASTVTRSILLIRLQPLLVDDFKPIYVHKRVLGAKCPNMVICLQTPKLFSLSLEASYQYDSNYPSTTICT